MLQPFSNLRQIGTSCAQTMRWRLLFLATLIAVSLTARGADTAARFTLPSGVAITIVEAPFSEAHYPVSCSKDRRPCLINGRVPFGAIEAPTTYVKRITATFEKRTFVLDSTDMYDAWGNRPLEQTGVIRYFGGRCYDRESCTFRGIFSDGAGTFVAEWVVVNGRAYRSVVTDSGDVVSLFMENIDPPEYD
jgi:hypothetical protein